MALIVGAAAFVVVAAIAVFAFAFRQAPIAGTGSVGSFATAAAAVVAAVALVLGMLAQPRAGDRRLHLRFVDVVDTVALAFAYGGIAALSWTLLTQIFSMGFVDAVVYGLPSILICGVVAATTAYLVFASASHLDLQQLALVLAAFLVEGVLAATLSAGDPHWWRDNLSALGMEGEPSARVFNVTVIVAGVLVFTLARYATAPLARIEPHGTTRVRVALMVIGGCLMVVGLVPVNVSFWVHTGFASGMLVVFAVLVVMIRRWIPEMPRTFLLFGWIVLAVIAVLVVFFIVGYYNLTAVELVAGGLVFAWIILFIRTVSAVITDAKSAGTTPDAPGADR